MKFKFLILSMLPLFACTQKEDTDHAFDYLDIDDHKIETIYNISNIFESVKIVELETTPESLIAEITSLIIHEGNIYILDIITESVFVFDRDGNYVSKIQNVGEGPDEYLNVNNFDIDAQKRLLVLFCGNKIQYYDLDNLSMVKQDRDSFPAAQKKYIGNDAFASYAANMQTRNNDKNLLLVKDNKIIDSSFPIEKNLTGYNLSQNYNFGMKNDMNYTWFVTPFSNEVYSINDKSINKNKKITFTSGELPTNIFSENPKEKFTEKLFSTNYSFLIDSYYESKINNMVYFNFRKKENIVTCFHKDNVTHLAANLLNDLNGVPINPTTFLYTMEEERCFVNYGYYHYVYEMLSHMDISSGSIAETILNVIPISLEEADKKQEDNPFLLFFYY
ncbi:hypothetical protein M2137_002657 [Parabacteroides sp. PFB2-10]|uniref:6-bladed beta-propeller n=1 Tax=Parabacteroides sp. PFB2-10 TaxID=1742405 RepID=UPI0024760D5F|nr:6-bladed beta-propeller [Parabacteroides sp. PFB2-10]MDH6313866.1 hypothetical protein [Parabacteroides sp. PFB2-10]